MGSQRLRGGASTRRARRRLQRLQEQPQQPPRGGPVASGPLAGRMQPEAARGGREAMCGGVVDAHGVDGRFGRFV